uniref:SURP and G-patch domain containing 1 n=1 Tax=Oryctolagus cuniculus TaxID=9986 RepID=A0A5F9CIG0_RABIT
MYSWSLKMDNRDVAGKANRWFGVAPPKSAKMNMNTLHQEELIAQKKREIEARMEQKAKQSQMASPQPPHPGEVANTHNSSCVSNKFANDRSFLQQFLKLQKAQTTTDATASTAGARPAHPRPALARGPCCSASSRPGAGQRPGPGEELLARQAAARGPAAQRLPVPR